MIDGSELPFEDNVRLSKQVVKIAKAYNANVEAELGYVAKLGQSHLHNGFTRVDEARDMVGGNRGRCIGYSDRYSTWIL